jgi:hypothetical protein
LESLRWKNRRERNRGRKQTQTRMQSCQEYQAITTVATSICPTLMTKMMPPKIRN